MNINFKYSFKKILLVTVFGNKKISCFYMNYVFVFCVYLVGKFLKFKKMSAFSDNVTESF